MAASTHHERATAAAYVEGHHHTGLWARWGLARVGYIGGASLHGIGLGIQRELFAIGPRRGRDRLALGDVGWPNQLVLAVLDLGDENGVCVLALGVEGDRAERGLDVELADLVGDR